MTGQRTPEETRRRRALIERQLAALPSGNKPRRELVSLNKDGKPVHKTTGNGKLVGGSALFKLVGGKYNDMEIRVFAPWEPVVFPNGDTYVYSDEPVSLKSNRHVFICQ